MTHLAESGTGSTGRVILGSVPKIALDAGWPVGSKGVLSVEVAFAMLYF